MAFRPARLIAGDGAQGVDEGLGVQQLPQAVGAAFGQRMGDRHRTAQAQDVLRRIGALDAVETAGGRRNQVGEGGHGRTRLCEGRGRSRRLGDKNTPKSRMTHCRRRYCSHFVTT
jgi:hypothetical protein